MWRVQVLFTASKSCQMIRFKDDFTPMKITTKPQKDDVTVVARKDLGLYMESGEVTGDIFFLCFWEEN